MKTTVFFVYFRFLFWTLEDALTLQRSTKMQSVWYDAEPSAVNMTVQKNASEWYKNMKLPWGISASIWAELNISEYLSLGYYFAISQNTNICVAPFFSCSPLCSCQQGQSFTLLAFGGRRTTADQCCFLSHRNVLYLLLMSWRNTFYLHQQDQYLVFQQSS